MPSRFTTCILPVQTRHPCTCTVEWCTVCMSKHSATAIRRVLRQQAVLPQARGQAPTWELVMPGRHGAGSIPFSPAHVCVAAKHMRLHFRHCQLPANFLPVQSISTHKYARQRLGSSVAAAAVAAK